MKLVTLNESVKWFIGGFCDDGYLITADRIDETATLDNCLGSHENKIYLVHDIGDGGIEHDCARNSNSREGVMSFDAKTAWTCFCYEY